MIRWLAFMEAFSYVLYTAEGKHCDSKYKSLRHGSPLQGMYVNTDLSHSSASSFTPHMHSVSISISSLNTSLIFSPSP